MTLRRFSLLTVVTTAMALLSVPLDARAATCTYSPPQSGTNPRLWSDATQWTGCVPGAGDTAIVALTVSPGVSLEADGVTVKNLVLSGDDNTGYLVGSGLTVSGGTFTWQGGILGQITLTVDATSTTSITTASDHGVSSANLVLQSPTTWDGQGLISGSGGGAITNNSTFTCTHGGMTGYSLGDNQATFFNAGTFVIPAGGADVTVGNYWAFNNTGTIDLEGGNLLLTSTSNGIHQFTGGTITGSGEVRVGAWVDGGSAGGTIDVEGSIALGNMELAQGSLMTSTAATFVGGTFIWSGSTISGPGTITFSPTTTLKLSGDAIGSRYLPTGTIDSQGEAFYTGNGDLEGGNGLFINDGTFTDQTDGLFQYGASVFLNRGTLIKNGTAGNWVFANWGFQNQGVVDVETGEIDLQFASNQDHVFLDGGSFEGPGTLLVEGAVDVSGSQTIAAGGTVELATGTLHSESAPAIFTGPGTLLWSGGTLDDDQGSGFNIDVLTQLVITGSAYKTSNTSQFTILGTTSWIAEDGGVEINGNLDNQGNFSIGCDSLITENGSGSLITNEGRISKTDTEGTTHIRVQIINNGSVYLGSGTLLFGHAQYSPYSQTAGDTTLDGGSLVLRELGNFPDGGGPIQELDVNSGILAGFGDVTGQLMLTGILSPGAGSSPIGALNLTGDLTILDGGEVDIDLGGTDAGEFDTVAVSGQVTYAGNLQVRLANGYTLPSSGAQFPVMSYASESAAFGTIVPPAGDQVTADYQATQLVLNGVGQAVTSNSTSTSNSTGSTGTTGTSASTGSSTGSNGASTASNTSSTGSTGSTGGSTTTSGSSSGTHGSTGNSSGSTTGGNQKKSSGCGCMSGEGTNPMWLLLLLARRRRNR